MSSRAVRAVARPPLRRFGYTPRLRSHLAAGLLLLAGLVWLVAPLLWSALAPNGAQLAQEAPLMLAVEVVLLGLLALALWADGGFDPWTLGVALGLVGINCLVRACFNLGGGIEFNYALPLLAGIAGGAPVGIFVGACSCLLSQFGLDLVAVPLPGQLAVWALWGAAGGLLRRPRPALAWLLGCVLAFLLGPVSGLLLNLTGWVTAVGTDTTSFYPGLPPLTLLVRSWNFTQQTSLPLDLARGVTTASVVLLLGLPILRGLRPLWTPALTPAVDIPDPHTPDPRDVARRRDLTRFDALWRKESTDE